MHRLLRITRFIGINLIQETFFKFGGADLLDVLTSLLVRFWILLFAGFFMLWSCDVRGVFVKSLRDLFINFNLYYNFAVSLLYRCIVKSRILGK